MDPKLVKLLKPLIDNILFKIIESDEMSGKKNEKLRGKAKKKIKQLTTESIKMT